MSETSNREHRQASDDSTFVVPGDGREDNSSTDPGSNLPIVQVGNPPKDPGDDDQ